MEAKPNKKTQINDSYTTKPDRLHHAKKSPKTTIFQFFSCILTKAKSKRKTKYKVFKSRPQAGA